MNARVTQSMGSRTRPGQLLYGLLVVALMWAFAGAGVANAALTSAQQAQIQAAVLANPDGGDDLAAAINAILAGVSVSAAPAVVADIIAAVDAAGGSSGAFATAGTAIGNFVAQAEASGASAAAVAAITDSVESAVADSSNPGASSANSALADAADDGGDSAGTAPEAGDPGAPPVPPCSTNSQGECID